jgi:hypothetical protein
MREDPNERFAMPEQKQAWSEVRRNAPRRSVLVPWGGVLVLLALFAPRRIQSMAEAMDAGGLRSLLFIMTDVFRLAFFVGVAFLIIGVLRNRRYKREAEMRAPGGGS